MPDRELIDTGKDNRYVRRDDQGQFKESEDVGRSSAQDQRRDAKNDTRKGQGRPRRPQRQLAAPRSNGSA